MSSIGSSSSTNSTNLNATSSTSASATNSAATNSNTVDNELHALAIELANGSGEVSDLAFKHVLSFLEPSDNVNFRLTSRRGSEIADSNDVWAEFVTDEAKADLKARKTTDGKPVPLKEREMTTATVGDKTVPAVQSWGAYQQVYMSNLNARRLYVGGAAELNQIILKLLPLYQTATQVPENVVQYAKLIQLNILRVEDFVDEARVVHHPLNLSALSVKILDRLIDLFQERKLTRQDLEVLSIGFHLDSSIVRLDQEDKDFFLLKMIQNYLDLKALGLNADHIHYYAYRSYTNEFYKGLQICTDVVQKKLLSVAQLVELYNENREDDQDHFHAMTPTLVKYIEEGLISFDMLKLLGDEIDSLSLLVSVDGTYGNKMRALYEGLCQQIKADGDESWTLFSTHLFKVFAMLFMQRLGPSFQVGNYFSANLVDPSNQSYGLSDAGCWTEIVNKEMTSESLFALFAELKAIVAQEGAEFSPLVLKNLVFILASQLDAVISENDSISFKVIRETAILVLKVLLSKQSLTKLSEIISMNLCEVLEQGEYTEAMLTTVKPYNMTQLMHAFILINFALTTKGLKPKAEIQTFVKDLQLLVDFFENFKKPQKMPAEFDTAEYVEELMGLFMRDLMHGNDRGISSQQLPVLLTALQNALNNGIVDRFVKAVKEGLPAGTEINSGRWEVDWIAAYLIANHQGVLELSDITKFLINRQSDTTDGYTFASLLTDALDIDGELGALLDGKATKEQWLNGTIDLQALAELEAGSESEGSDESDDDAAAPAISGRIRGNNDDDDGSDSEAHRMNHDELADGHQAGSESYGSDYERDTRPLWNK